MNLFATKNLVAFPSPSKTKTRWQPLRSGLLNLYRYDREEFWFEDGHLLLRGNNGSGKSRVLALQLPFLLDGEVSPQRVEPDGDPAKRMEWNLLLGRYEDRVGYTWLELGRRDEDGTEHFLTLGCGLSATAGRTGVTRWFFITRQRVGKELFLEGALGQPLARDRLEQAVAGHGQVFQAARDYRAAVDAALFKLGTHRYEALVTLLIRLRMPQLSRSLDEKTLSQALSEALPPLSRTVVDDVAESFRSLEKERSELQGFLDAGAAVERFLATYKRYVQIAARRRADRVRTAHSGYEATQRRLRAAESEAEQAAEALALAQRAQAEAETEHAAARAELRALESSESMRSAQALDEKRQQAEQRTRDAQQVRGAHASAARQLVSREQEHQRNEERRRAREAERDEALQSAEAAAQGLGIAERWAQTIAPELALEERGERLEPARREWAALLERRRKGARHLRALEEKVAQARHALALADARFGERQGVLERALERRREAGLRLAAERETLLSALREWREALTVLAPRDDVDLESAIDAWSEEREGPLPSALWIREAAQRATEALAGRGASLAQRAAEVERERSRAADELAQLEQGRHLPPPAPHTRDDAARAARDTGAPLWKLCDFASDVPESDRAGVEAALEAAGLLDAWVMPDGRLLRPGEHDVALLGGAPVEDVSKSLAALLRPSIDPSDAAASTVAPETVAAILRAIGAAAGVGQVWIDPSGAFRVGPLRGAWTKESAEHIGHSAREHARRGAIARLRGELNRLDAERQALADERSRLDEAMETARLEEADAPDGKRLLDAAADIGATERQIGAERERVAEAERALAEARSRHEHVSAARDEEARDLGLSDWLGRVDELERGLDSLVERCGRAVHVLERWRDAALEARQSLARCDETALQVRFWEERAQVAMRDADAARIEFETLHAIVGAQIAELQRRLENARKRETFADQEITEQRTRAQEQALARERARVEADSQRAQLGRDTSAREDAIETLWALAHARLLRLLDVELEGAEAERWSVTRAVDVARRIEAACEDIDSSDTAWGRAEKEILSHFNTLTDALVRYDIFVPAGENAGGLFVASVTYAGRKKGMAELRASLSDEVLQRQTLLDAREREVLENHLIGEVAQQLHELLHRAEDWVRRISHELENRPTSTGMALRFCWDPAADGPAGLAEARKSLLRAPGTWSPDERQVVGAFLKAQIDRARAEDDSATWQEHLERALDYRGWHQFAVERKQDGQWKRLTRRTHGTGSGGEKALALTLPQFAAAAAHYSSADPHAPRLILLDEAFVGIDTDMRAKCMGLLEAFDLDFVMTSEREWGCYATLPGVAICQLTTHPGVDAVHVTRFVWNGRQKVKVDAVLPPARAPEAEP